jgi:plasmid stabilization system protein ParE
MASKQIEFHEDAAAEYEAAFDWYFERSQLAAQKFSIELSHAVESVAENPQRWPRHLLNTRRFFLRHFPFAVIYRELPSTIQILAVAHGHRQPDYWRNRS